MTEGGTGRPASMLSGRAVALPRRTLLDTEDVAEAESVVGGLLSANRVHLDQPNDPFRVLARSLAVADLEPTHFRYGGAFTVRSRPLPCYAVNLTLTGRSRARRGGELVGAEVDEALVFSPSDPFSVAWSRDAEVLCLTVPQTAMHEHLRKLTGRPSVPIVFGPRTRAGTAHLLYSSIGTALQRSGGETAGLSSALAWQLRDAVLTAMLLDLPHDRQADLFGGRATAASRLCDAAESLMRDTLAAPPSVPALAGRLGVSERSLQASFREDRRTTPSARFKQLRLDAVHAALVGGQPHRHTVAALAADTGGFTHHGRFAAEYLERFGESPSQTLRRP